MEKTQLPFKNILLLTTLFSILGGFFGYLITSILAAIAIPNMSSYFMPIKLFNLMYDGEYTQTFSYTITQNIPIVSTALLLVSLVIFYLWIKAIIPHSLINWKNHKIKISILLVLIGGSLSYLIHSPLILITSISSDSAIKVGHFASYSATSFIAFVILILCIRSISPQTFPHFSKLLHVILFSATGTIIFIILSYYLSIVVEQFFSIIFALGEAGETTVLGWNRIYTSLTFAGLISYACFSSFSIWLLKPKPLHNASLPVLCTIIILFLGQSFMNYSNNQLHMKFGSLAKAANLIQLPQPKPIKTVVIIDNMTEVTLKTISYREGNVYGFNPSGEVDLIPENNQNLYDYIRSDRYTYYTDSAMSALSEISKRQWDIEGFRKASFHIIENNGGVLYSMTLLASITDSPFTPQNKITLARLSDENKYLIKDQSAYNIAKSWITFEEIEKAKHFYDKAIKTMNKKDIATWDELIEQYQFNTGHISGNITNVPSGTKIALIKGEANAIPSFHKIKNILTLNESGSFSFDHLPIGKYTLAAMLPDDTLKPKQVTGGKMIEISPESPKYHSEIRVEY